MKSIRWILYGAIVFPLLTWRTYDLFANWDKYIPQCEAHIMHKGQQLIIDTTGEGEHPNFCSEPIGVVNWDYAVVYQPGNQTGDCAFDNKPFVGDLVTASRKVGFCHDAGRAR